MELVCQVGKNHPELESSEAGTEGSEAEQKECRAGWWLPGESPAHLSHPSRRGCTRDRLSQAGHLSSWIPGRWEEEMSCQDFEIFSPS